LRRDCAAALIEQLHAPDQRFARAFYRYWREVLGQSAAEAQRSTYAELDEAAQALLRNLDDPHVHTIGVETRRRYEPFGIFAFRDLEEHTRGRILARHLQRSHLDARYPGRLGIGHAVALLDEHATRRALQSVLLSIARKALAGRFSFVFFFSSDTRLARLYRRFGMEFPPDVCFPDSAHLVGVYEAAAPRNLERVALAAEQLQVEECAPI
jgi:hypothetical protein